MYVVWLKKGSSSCSANPGGAVLKIYDEIFKQNKFKHVLVRHEQAACMRRRLRARDRPGGAWRW